MDFPHIIYYSKSFMVKCLPLLQLYSIKSVWISPGLRHLVLFCTTQYFSVDANLLGAQRDVPEIEMTVLENFPWTRQAKHVRFDFGTVTNTGTFKYRIYIEDLALRLTLLTVTHY